MSVMCFKKILCGFQDSDNCLDFHQSSDIRPDDMVILSELPSVSRSFEVFKVASVRTSQQHVWTPFSVRQVKGFPSYTQIWEDSYNRPDDRSTPSRRYP